MTKHFRYSKIFHVVAMCCFLLPFFHYTGCGASKVELEKKEKTKQDSIQLSDSLAGVAVAGSKHTNQDTISIRETEKLNTIRQENIKINPLDTIVQNTQVDTLNKQSATMQKDTTSTAENEDETPSKKFSSKFPFFRPILIPSTDTYTGIATVIDSVPYLIFFSSFVSFLLLTIGLMVKYIEIDARKTIFLLDISALICLIISIPPILEFFGSFEKLWGFWTCVTILSLLAIYDLYMIKLYKQFHDSKQGK
jgi:hypothetical protein